MTPTVKSTLMSDVSGVTLRPLSTHHVDERRGAHTGSGLKAFYCSSRLRTKKVACQNLFSRRRHRATNWPMFSEYIFFPLQFRVLLPLSTCYFHFKKGPGTCGRVRVKSNSSLIPRHYFQVLLGYRCKSGLKRWKQPQVKGRRPQKQTLLIINKSSGKQTMNKKLVKIQYPHKILIFVVFFYLNSMP